MCTGANDKYQLGVDPDQRSLRLFNFQPIQSLDRLKAKLGDAKFTTISCWNLNAAIDEQNRVFLWGLLYDKEAKQSLCIKSPEVIPDLQVKDVAIGATMALLIEEQTLQSFVIGVNAKGELGLGDKKQRKTLSILNEIQDKRISKAAIGRSGFVIALSEHVSQPSQELQNEKTEEVPRN